MFKFTNVLRIVYLPSSKVIWVSTRIDTLSLVECFMYHPVCNFFVFVFPFFIFADYSNETGLSFYVWILLFALWRHSLVSFCSVLPVNLGVRSEGLLIFNIDHRPFPLFFFWQNCFIGCSELFQQETPENLVVFLWCW